MALIRCCSAFLTNDSGPMHIAAALGTPLLALFGSTNEVKTGPYPKGRVIHKHVECSPCYKRVCPIDFRCMKRIEVDEVYNELMDVLKESGQDAKP
jgi:heptosyltransferase-2